MHPTSLEIGQIANVISEVAEQTNPGDIQNGYWYTSGTHVGASGAGQFSGNYGIYGGWDQLLLSETCDATQGLGTFFIYSWAPQNRNIVQNQFAIGLVYRGLLSGRGCRPASRL